MNKYTDIEIKTAEKLLKCGFKWLMKNEFSTIFAYSVKPVNEPEKYMPGEYVSSVFVPIFESIKSGEPVSLEAIVHPQILDDEERRYLSAVIRPFRDRVQYIAKAFADDACVYRINCYIFIHFNDGSDDMDFPVFHESKMYKGMKSDKAYTLEELGL